MSKEKYQEDLKRADEIAKMLEEKKKDKSTFDLATLLSSKIGLKPSSCIALLNNLPNPYFISDRRKINKNWKRQQYEEEHLYRVAVIYELLEIKADDPVIELTKQINAAFHYPPAKPAEKPYSCTIKEKFSHKELKLKPEQRKDLEQLALQYALENKNSH